MSAQRTCLGCGGVGGSMLHDPWYRVRCLVCWGRGTVDARPSMRDAVADAETLHELASEIHSVHYGRTTIAKARRYGRRAIRTLEDMLDSGPMYAAAAARAAFRAVPGLRGGDTDGR